MKNPLLTHPANARDPGDLVHGQHPVLEGRIERFEGEFMRALPQQFLRHDLAFAGFDDDAVAALDMRAGRYNQ